MIAPHDAAGLRTRRHGQDPASPGRKLTQHVITDYLTWARHIDGWLAEHPDVANLFGSAVYEPGDMLRDDLQRARQSDFRDRLDAPTAWGHPRLLEAITAHYHLPGSDHVLITSGASMAFLLVCQALLRPGDHVIVETPHYQPFSNVLHALGVTISWLPRTGDAFLIDPAQLESLLQPQTRLIVLTNLHNPGGAVLDEMTLRSVAALASQHNLHVVIDEVYRDFVAGDRQTAAQGSPSLIAINSLTKAYGLGVLRCGWIAADADVIERIKPAHVLFDNSGSRLTQAIATVVLDNLDRYRQRALDIVAENRRLVTAAFDHLVSSERITGQVPAHGCITFPRVVDVAETDALARALREQHGVIVVPGRFFNAPGHIRLSFGGRPAGVQRGLERLVAALDR